MSAYADCPRCGTHLIWARLPSGKHIPLNRDPDPQGLAAAMQTTTLTWHARIAAAQETLHPPWKRYAIHDAACATQDAPRNVTQLTTWRQAQTAHNAAKRRARTTRAPDRTYRGYRRTP